MAPGIESGHFNPIEEGEKEFAEGEGFEIIGEKPIDAEAEAGEGTRFVKIEDIASVGRKKKRVGEEGEGLGPPSENRQRGGEVLSREGISDAEVRLREIIEGEPNPTLREWVARQVEKIDGIKMTLVDAYEKVKGLPKKRDKKAMPKIHGTDYFRSLAYELDQEAAQRKMEEARKKSPYYIPRLRQEAEERKAGEAAKAVAWKPEAPQQISAEDKQTAEKENLERDVEDIRAYIAESEARVEELQNQLIEVKVRLRKEGRSLSRKEYDSLDRGRINLFGRIKEEEEDLKLKKEELETREKELLKIEGSYKMKESDLKQTMADLAGKLEELQQKERTLGKYKGREGGIYDKLQEQIRMTEQAIERTRGLLKESGKGKGEKLLEEFDALKKSSDLEKVHELWKNNAAVWIKRTSGDWQKGAIDFLIGENLRVEWFDEKKGKKQGKYVEVSDLLKWQRERDSISVKEKPIKEEPSVVIDKGYKKEVKEAEAREQEEALKRQEAEGIRAAKRKIQDSSEQKHTGGLIEESREAYKEELNAKIDEKVTAIDFLNAGIQRIEAEAKKLTKKDDQYWPGKRAELDREMKKLVDERIEKAKELSFSKEKFSRLEQGREIDKSHETYLELQAYVKERGAPPKGKTLENYLSFSSREYENVLGAYQRAVENLEANGKTLGWFGRRRAKKEISVMERKVAAMQDEIYGKIGVKAAGGKQRSREENYQWVKKV